MIARLRVQRTIFQKSSPVQIFVICIVTTARLVAVRVDWWNQVNLPFYHQGWFHGGSMVVPWWFHNASMMVPWFQCGSIMLQWWFHDGSTMKVSRWNITTMMIMITPSNVDKWHIPCPRSYSNFPLDTCASVCISTWYMRIRANPANWSPSYSAVICQLLFCSLFWSECLCTFANLSNSIFWVSKKMLSFLLPEIHLFEMLTHSLW